MSEHRFRADSRVAYGLAVRAMVEYARTAAELFFFGPLSWSRMEAEGLLLSGPGADGAAVVLEHVAGVTEVEA